MSMLTPLSLVQVMARQPCEVTWSDVTPGSVKLDDFTVVVC